MSRSAFKHLRILGPLTAAAALSISTLPAFAQTAPASSACSAIHFELANPGAASQIEPGGFVVQGIAMDSRAQQGLGIDHIDFFLDSREAGGMNLGTALPGMVPGPFGPTSFQTTISVPNLVGGHDLFAYAYSSVDGAESIISVPVAVGEDPTKAFQPQDETPTTSCMVGASTPATPATTPATTTTTTPATQPSTTTTTTPTTTTPVVSVSPAASTITLSVSNPSPNATIITGAYSIQGEAFDKAATSGNGIDRIDIFLDNRDTGGTFVGTATLGTSNLWQTLVNLPTNQTGLHELWFYAYSSVTGQSTAVSIPVNVTH